MLSRLLYIGRGCFCGWSFNVLVFLRFAWYSSFRSKGFGHVNAGGTGISTAGTFSTSILFVIGINGNMENHRNGIEAKDVL